MKVSLTKSFRFEAAHWLPTFPDGHKCRRMHGHSFVVDVIVEGEVAESAGYLIDYGQMKAAIKPVEEQLDHYLLNEIPGMENPTAEMLSRWVWQKLKPALPLLSVIRVHETCTTACEYRGQ